MLAAAAARRYFCCVRELARCWLGVGLVVVWTAGLACRAKDPAITGPFADDFQRADLGPSWNATGPQYRIEGGKLEVAGAYNHPAWLRRKLPRDAVVELDAQSKSPAGDLKIELYGDGESFDPDKGSYVSTGYVFIFGGWQNSLSVICRNHEHDDGRKAERRDRRVEPGRTYHWTVTRRGGALDWKIDDQPFLSWTDPDPLQGAGHEYLAVDDWESNVTFDNLAIRPAPAAAAP
jgi:hypothetical protein